jgi:gliding motility-associated-like protein
VNITDTGSYLFTLVASNVYGCTDTAVSTFTAYEGLAVVVPNVFTPNNDGTNDWFGITTSIAATAEVAIVNRWGNVVFEKTVSTKSDTFLPLWNGVSATDGTYFYKLKVTPLEITGDTQELSGFVEILR